MDMEQIAATLARHEERIDALEQYQAKQNGSLQRLETKVDKLYSQQMALLGGMVTSLLILVFNLLRGRGDGAGSP